jgi:uncharacterized membrane protein YuzA (DUF378 family)
MKALNLITLILVIVGGINWGLIAVTDFDLVANIFGADTGMANVVYGVVGLSALWQLVPFIRALGTGEVRAEANANRPVAR